MSYIGTLAYYTSSAKYASVTAWAATAAKTVGQLVRQLATPSVNNERIFMCIAAGTTGGSEPSWNLSRGVKTTGDGTVSWIEVTGQPGVNGDFTNTPNWTTVKNNGVDLGQIIKDNAGTHLFICTTSGSTGNGAEPSWSTGAVGNTTTDSSVTWMYIGTSFSGWAAPHARLYNAGQWGRQSQTNQYFVGSDHAETQSSGMNMDNGNTSQFRNLGSGQYGPMTVICVSTAGSTPPVSADLSTAGSIEVTGASSMTLSFGWLRWCYGLTFNNPSSFGVQIDIGGTEGAKDKFYESCAFIYPTGTSSGATIRINGNSYDGKVRLKNCTFKFGNTGQVFTTGGSVVIENCTFDTGVAIPSRLFQNNASGSYTQVIGCDLSSFGTNPLYYNGGGGDNVTIDFIDCKLPSAPVFATLFSTCTESRINFTRCDNGSAAYKSAAIDQSGQFTTDATIVRTGGASDGTTAFSWKVATTTFALGPQAPFDLPAIMNDNAVTGSTVNVTLHGIANAAALPTNDDIYMEVRYLGASGAPQGSFKTTKKTDFLGTTVASNLTADTGSAWDTAATARANSHAYSLGDIIKTASNSGRIFFCTSAGTSAGSEPGGYASAVDGGSVTDSGATFRAGVRFSFTIALSSPAPALAGYVSTLVSFGSPSLTCFLDPLAVLS